MMRNILSHTVLIATVLGFAGCGWRVDERPSGGDSSIGNQASLDVGDRVCLPGADLSRAERSLVVVADYSCPACKYSDKLLRTFVSRAAREAIPVFMVRSSSNAETSQAFFNLHAGTLILAPGSVTGIRRVPTILLADRHGVVTHLWTGAVDPGGEERTVEDFFEGKGYVTRPLESIDLRGLDELERHKVRFQLVDMTIPMKGNTASRLSGALSIPARDLSVRAPYELDRKQLVILDCRTTSAYECQDMILSLRKHGFERVAGLILGRVGQSPACGAHR